MQLKTERRDPAEIEDCRTPNPFINHQPPFICVILTLTLSVIIVSFTYQFENESIFMERLISWCEILWASCGEASGLIAATCKYI